VGTGEAAGARAALEVLAEAAVLEALVALFAPAKVLGADGSWLQAARLS
jgi:hypothetical protein